MKTSGRHGQDSLVESIHFTFASTTQGICLQTSRTQRHLLAKTRRDMEGFQLCTP